MQFARRRGFALDTKQQGAAESELRVRAAGLKFGNVTRRFFAVRFRR